MPEDPTFMCIDAGSENCPCCLAESGNCIVCGRLSGQDCSGCKWHGVCIYNEYIQNNRKIKQNREEFEAAVVEKKCYEDTVIIALSVGKGFSVKCYTPGTYIFLRRKDREPYFNVPISVMRTDVEAGVIYVLVKCISAKTKALLEDTDSLMVRGPYKNGIFGIDNMKAALKTGKTEGRRARFLVTARATGIAPTYKLMQWLGDKPYITVALDTASLDEELISEVLLNMPDDYMELDFTDSGDLLRLKIEMATGGYDCLVIFASDHYINVISEMAEDIDFQGCIAVSNNFNICCGEGVCGACSVAGKNGETMKMCKCKLSGEEVLRRRVVFK